jgi:hypothetical protein
VKWPANLASIVGSLLLGSCAGSMHPHAISGAEDTNAPRVLDLYSSTSVATLHFPAGSYSLAAVDHIGYYYRAPGAIIQHTAASSIARDGGIFVSKRSRAKLRGYVYLAGGVTLVGNFSKLRHDFHD